VLVVRGLFLKGFQAHHPVDSAHAFEVVLDQVIKPNGCVEVLLPALDTAVDTDWYETLLAYGAAKASRFVPGRQMGEGIAQIVELAAVEELGRHMVLQPQDLGDLHFNAHFATDISKEIVAGLIDLIRLIASSVVEPQNHVSCVAIVFKTGSGDGNWLVGVVGEHSQRAGGIEADALDVGGVYLGLMNYFLDAVANASPDVRCRLLLFNRVNETMALLPILLQLGAYVVTDMRLPHLYGLRGQRLDVSGGIDEASSGRACANINSHVVIL
jgi:hypothetical protein